MRIKVLISGLLAAGLLLGAASFSSLAWAMGGVAVLIQLIFAFTWPRMTQSEAPWPLTIILSLAALASSAATIFASGSTQMSHSVEVIATGVLLVFISQVVRGAEAEGRLAGVVSGVAGLALVSQGAGWAAIGTSSDGFAISLVTVVALFAAGGAAITRLPNRLVFILAPLISGAVGAAMSALPMGLSWYQTLAIGVLSGLLVGSFRVLALSTRSVRTLAGILALSSGIILLAGALSWYASQLLS